MTKFTLKDYAIYENDKALIPLFFVGREDAERITTLLNLGQQTQERMFKKIMAALADHSALITEAAEQTAREISEMMYE